MNVKNLCNELKIKVWDIWNKFELLNAEITKKYPFVIVIIKALFFALFYSLIIYEIYVASTIIIFNKNCLSAHQIVRNTVPFLKNPPTLNWNWVLADSAQKWADHLTLLNKGLVHGGSNGAGQNLAFSSETLTCESSVKLWFDNEKKKYHGQKIGDGDFEGYGHYTQIADSQVTSIGCSLPGKPFFVCHYSHMQISGSTVPITP